MQEYTVKVYENRTEWFQNDQRHRLDGPAVERADGTKFWFQNGQLHRIDGPAVELANGDKEWWVNGQRHRLDGPAKEWVDGTKSWWLEGERLTEAEFNARTNPQPVELTLDQIAQLFGVPVEQLKIKK